MDFYNLPTASIANRFLRLDYLAQAGPRLVRLVMAGSEDNLLGETPHIGWETPYGDYQLYGGHRLWHAPEVSPRSSIPDEGGLHAQAIPGGVRLMGEREAPTGLRKGMQITLMDDRPALQIVHTIRNEGLWPVELSLWAITILPGGGLAVVGQQRGDPNAHSPDRQIALWPDTRWEDPRFHFFDEALVVESTPGLPYCKLGTFARQGWLAYQRQGWLFVKHSPVVECGRYPDGGSNAEVFCSPEYIELETLSPLLIIQPGETASHTETWSIFPAPPAAASLKQSAVLIAGLANTASG